MLGKDLLTSFGMLSRRTTIVTLAFALIFVAAGSSPAFAAKGAGGGGHKGPAPSASFTLILLNSTDGVPHWGQLITFTMSSTATTEPNVGVVCYQNGALVYGAVAGFYPGYPWPWDQTFVLASPSWTGGAATCTATLYYISRSSTVSLATMTFQVYP
jgi:hypothetical protein